MYLMGCTLVFEKVQDTQSFSQQNCGQIMTEKKKKKFCGPIDLLNNL